MSNRKIEKERFTPDAFIDRLYGEFGILPRYALQGLHWGAQWGSVLKEHGLREPNEKEIEYARQVALEQCPEVELCGNGRPLFQIEYAAEQSLYATHTKLGKTSSKTTQSYSK